MWVRTTVITLGYCQVSLGTIPTLYSGLDAAMVGLEALTNHLALCFDSAIINAVAGGKCLIINQADVAELADALDSKSGTRKGVWVRPPPSAPLAGCFPWWAKRFRGSSAGIHANY